jgi:hypothetical protein
MLLFCNGKQAGPLDPAFTYYFSQSSFAFRLIVGKKPNKSDYLYFYVGLDSLVWIFKTSGKILIICSELGYPERCHSHCFNLQCFRLHYFINNFLSLPLKKIVVVIYFHKILRSSSFSKILRSSSSSKKN